MKISKKVKQYFLAAVVSLSFISSPIIGQAAEISEEHKRIIQNAKVGFKTVNEARGFLFEEKNNHQVVYMFSYNCPYCYIFNSYMEQWGDNLRDSVSYHKVPVSFVDGWDAASKAYIISTFLKINGSDFDKNMYGYIHDEGKSVKTKDELIAFFKAKYPSIESKKVKELYESKKVRDVKNTFDSMVDGINLETTPSLLVINKEGDIRLTSPAIADGELNALFTVEYLIYLDSIADDLKVKKK